MQFYTTAALLMVLGQVSADPVFSKQKPYSQEFLDNYNVLKYTSWMGPFTQRRGVGLSRDPPNGCRVDQVAMLHRHGERYPDTYSVVQYNAALEKIFKKRGELEGSLEFANFWQPFTDIDSGYNGQETEFGDYAGLHGAYKNGIEYRARYGSLYDGESTLPIFSAAYERIVESARAFGKGFLGYNYTELANLQLIPETPDQGANSLTARCHLPNITNCPVRDAAARTNWPDSAQWIYPEFTKAANRLNKENNITLTGEDVIRLLELAAFELNVRGSSPWVNVFTSEEWIAGNYYQSSFYYCYAGPGSPSAPYEGTVYLNATRELLRQGPEKTHPLIFSFAHDTDITPVITLLGFANDTEYDPRKVSFNKHWDISDLTPQNARIVFERLICDADEVGEPNTLGNKFPLAFTGGNSTGIYMDDSANAGTFSNASNGTFYEGAEEVREQIIGGGAKNSTGPSRNATGPSAGSHHQNSTSKIYIRVVLNEAVVPIPGCDSGPGKSCPFEGFDELVTKAVTKYPYARDCIPVDSKAPQFLEFFWIYNITNQYNNRQRPIGFQASFLDFEGNPY